MSIRNVFSAILCVAYCAGCSSAPTSPQQGIEAKDSAVISAQPSHDSILTVKPDTARLSPMPVEKMDSGVVPK